VVRRGVAEHVVGRTIATADIRGGRVARRHGPGPVDLADRIRGATVRVADRRGKYLWLVLSQPREDPVALVIHLGMSGQLLVQSSAQPEPKHTHASFAFDDASGLLRFVDQRTFGGLSLSELLPDSTHPWGIPSSIAHIAADPLESAFDQGAVIATLKRRHTAIKRSLLDQRLVSGIGNIYADEALWRAGVHGRRTSDLLTKPTLRRVLDQAADVMNAALMVGGTSFDALYVNVNGASGYFDRSLDAYGQTGRPCGRCGAAIRRAEFMNRSSHYCPRCQPAPRARR